MVNKTIKGFQMIIQVSSEAAAWYKEELALNDGDSVRFFVHYGGCSTVQSGFSLGISIEEPMDTGVSTEKDGITFYIESKDLWYFDNHDLMIDFNREVNEPVFNYEIKKDA